jgi:hypothetical protein
MLGHFQIDGLKGSKGLFINEFSGDSGLRNILVIP